MSRELETKLSDLLPGRVAFGVSLAGLTTYGLGGPAWALAEPRTAEDLGRLLDFLKSHHLVGFILGGGSNVLFDDQGFDGVVVRLGDGWNSVRILEPVGTHVLVEAGAGAKTADLVAFSREEGLAGLEFLAGIPGRIGGALAMNAGAFGHEIARILESLTMMTLEAGLQTLAAGGLTTGYRRLDLPQDAVITKAVFRLTPSTPDQVAAVVREHLARRSAGQPRKVRSAGSVFKNPEGDAAGRLIDRAGLKGYRCGGAFVADEHANFIVHDGGATTADVLAVMVHVVKTVKETFGIELEPEIKVIGKDGKAGWPCQR